MLILLEMIDASGLISLLAICASLGFHLPLGWSIDLTSIVSLLARLSWLACDVLRDGMNIIRGKRH